MRPKEAELRRVARRLVQSFLEKEWVEAAGPADALEERVFEALQGNFEEEARLETDARKMLDDLGSKAAGMDQHKLFLRIKQQLAKDRNFVL